MSWFRGDFGIKGILKICDLKNHSKEADQS
jgi:hypothetical protein